MKEINPERLKQDIVQALSHIGYNAGEFVRDKFIKCADIEDSEIAIDILHSLVKNIDIAAEGNFPLCQDTGLVVFWVKKGEGVQVKNLEQTLNKAVIEAFSKNNFRHSVVRDPIDRVNTGNNAPAIIHIKIVPEDIFEINIMLKGGGSENMSALKMLKPADGIQGIRDFIIETVKNAGGKACPPLFIGVGIGGNFETCAWLAKKALFRETENTGFWLSEEQHLLNEINKLNIGPMGLGGKITAIKVNIETAPCHIACLPVAVNLECHAHRCMMIKY